MNMIDGLQDHVEGHLSLLAPIEQAWQPTDYLPDLTAEDWSEQLGRFRATARRLPGFLARQLPDGSPALLRLLDRLVRLVMTKPTAGWAMRRNLMVHGLSDPLEYFRIAPQYSLKGIEGRIQCPTFVCSAEGDDLSTDARKLYEALTCPKVYYQFTAAEGAGHHCESGARALFHARAFDWLGRVLNGSARAEPAAAADRPAGR